MANPRISTSRRSAPAAILSPPEGFLRAYHIAPTKFAIENIRFGRIKVARFIDLNDPFELLAMNFMERTTRKIVGNFKIQYDSHNGLLCFSEQWKNPILWSHYGDRHRGVCLGFNLKKDLVQRVRYEDTRIRAELEERGSPLEIDKTLQDMLICTKFSHWKRIIVLIDRAVKDGSMHFRKFDENLQLAEVILGPKCDESLDSVRRLARARYPDVAVFKSRLGFKFFNVVPDKRTVGQR